MRLNKTHIALHNGFLPPYLSELLLHCNNAFIVFNLFVHGCHDLRVRLIACTCARSLCILPFTEGWSTTTEKPVITTLHYRTIREFDVPQFVQPQICPHNLTHRQ
eukprot:CFRG0722T1